MERRYGATRSTVRKTLVNCSGLWFMHRCRLHSSLMLMHGRLTVVDLVSISDHLLPSTALVLPCNQGPVEITPSHSICRRYVSSHAPHSTMTPAAAQESLMSHTCFCILLQFPRFPTIVTYDLFLTRALPIAPFFPNPLLVVTFLDFYT